MTPAIACICAFATYFLAYRYYSKFLADRLYELRSHVKTPAVVFRDGVDYVPTKVPVLFVLSENFVKNAKPVYFLSRNLDAVETSG